MSLLTYAVCCLIGHRWRKLRFGNHAHTICVRCGAALDPDADET